jgi:hypothetical protein
VLNISSSSIGGFAQIGENLGCRKGSVRAVFHAAEMHAMAEVYGRIMGGSDQKTDNPVQVEQSVQFMHIAQSRINTGYFASR